MMYQDSTVNHGMTDMEMIVQAKRMQEANDYRMQKIFGQKGRNSVSNAANSSNFSNQKRRGPVDVRLKPV